MAKVHIYYEAEGKNGYGVFAGRKRLGKAERIINPRNHNELLWQAQHGGKVVGSFPTLKEAGRAVAKAALGTK